MRSLTNSATDHLIDSKKQTEGCVENPTNDKNQDNLQIRKKTRRLDSIDILRGFIIVIMAWDHTKDFLTRFDGRSLAGGDPDANENQWVGHYNMYQGHAGYFVLRGVSNICAPAFSYLMGVGMALLTSSRIKKGWTSWQILKFFQIRGVVLILLGFVVRGSNLVIFINPDPDRKAWHPDFYSSIMGFWQVMTSLGMQMLLCAWLLVPLEKFKSKSYSVLINAKRIHPNVDFSIFSIIISLCGAICFAITAIVIHYRQHGNPAVQKLPKETDFIGILWTFLMVPGEFGSVSTMVYPAIPWIGFCLFGMCGANELSTRPNDGHFRHLINGIIFLIIFLILRFMGGRGFSFRGWPINEGREKSEFISFLGVCKYPPSITFFLVTTGFNSILLYIFHKLSFWAHNPPKLDIEKSFKNRHSFLRKLILSFLKINRAYGRAPLIFYVLHLYLIRLIEVIIYTAQGSKGPGGIPLEFVPLIWLFIILPLMYPVCVKYGQFKSNTSPNSLWRLF